MYYEEKFTEVDRRCFTLLSFLSSLTPSYGMESDSDEPLKTTAFVLSLSSKGTKITKCPLTFSEEDPSYFQISHKGIHINGIDLGTLSLPPLENAASALTKALSTLARTKKDNYWDGN